MQFTQIEFVALLLAVLLVVWRTSNRVVRNSILLVVSYYFYAYWDYRFCGLLLLSTGVDYVAGSRIAVSAQAGKTVLALHQSGCQLGRAGLLQVFQFLR